MASNPQLHLMTNLLKIEGFIVKDYQIVAGVGILIDLEKKDQKADCPKCGYLTEKLHQNHFFVVRDLAWGEQAVYLNVNRRQMRCKRCSQKFSEELSFLKKKRTYTERFRNKIIAEVLESDVKNVAKRNGVSEQEIETMLKELGAELIAEVPQGLCQLGIDEIAVVKGQKNYYVVLVDLSKKALVGIISKRTSVEVEEYLKAWGEEVLSQIKKVSIDLWKPYKKVAEKLMPQAEIVADRFHVMKQVNEELDAARKQQKKSAEQLKNKPEREKVLSGLANSKYVLLKNEQDLTDAEKQKLKSVSDVAPNLRKMHNFKEEFRQVFEQSQDWVDGLFNLSDWLKNASAYFPNSCATIKRWIGEVIAYFDNGTTQGVVEGINNKLKLIKRKAYGFRNFDNFRLRSLLHWHFPS